MSTEKNEFILFFRNTNWTQGLSPEQIQQVMGQWKGWYEGLSSQGKVKAGHPLEREGKIVSGKNGRVVADGPFAESKEAVGGYFLLEVGSMEEAVTIAKNCPGLPYGCVVEVRQVAAICPCDKAMETAGELATAAA
jgi:hypothetical protein